MKQSTPGMTRPLARAAILALSVILSSCAPSAGSAAFWGGFWQGYDGGSSYAPISTHSAYGAVESVITSDFSGFSTGEVFVLANGAHRRCDAPGAKAAAAFRVQKGKIVSWVQVPVPEPPGPTA